MAELRSSKMMRLYLIESQRLFGKALAQVFALDEEVTIVGDSAGVDAGDLSRARPSLIILGADGDSSQLLRSLAACRAAVPAARVCVLSAHPQPALMQQCLANGADGYVLKDATPSELLAAVKLVAQGEAYVDSRVAGGVLRRHSGASGRSTRRELSVREVEIIRLIAEGLSNKEISSKLALSEKTVKNHISRIFGKLQINARSQAAVHAIRMGIC